MNNDEFKSLTKEYVVAMDEHRKYFNQFISSYVDGVEVQKATKVITLETSEKLKELREKADTLAKKWLDEIQTGVKKS